MGGSNRSRCDFRSGCACHKPAALYLDGSGRDGVAEVYLRQKTLKGLGPWRGKRIQGSNVFVIFIMPVIDGYSLRITLKGELNYDQTY